jgi:hypothetical protein
MKTIEISVDETGEVTVDLHGFHGQGCQKVLSDFSAGDRVKIERTKPEFRETVVTKEQAKQ